MKLMLLIFSILLIGCATQNKKSTGSVPDGLAPDVVDKILFANVPKLQDCYQRGLDRSNLAFKGVVRMNFIISSSGRVTKATIHSDKSFPSLVKKCLVKVLKIMKFPKPKNGGVVEVNQPINFNHESQFPPMWKG